MIPGNLPFTVRQGESFDRTIFFKQADKITPLVLTGYTAKMDIRNSPGSTAIASLSSGNGITIDGTAGSVRLQINKTVTLAFKPGSYAYDLFLIDASGTAKPYLAGSFNIMAGITQ